MAHLQEHNLDDSFLLFFYSNLRCRVFFEEKYVFLNASFSKKYGIKNSNKVLEHS